MRDVTEDEKHERTMQRAFRFEDDEVDDEVDEDDVTDEVGDEIEWPGDHIEFRVVELDVALARVLVSTRGEGAQVFETAAQRVLGSQSGGDAASQSTPAPRQPPQRSRPPSPRAAGGRE